LGCPGSPIEELIGRPGPFEHGGHVLDSSTGLHQQGMKVFASFSKKKCFLPCFRTFPLAMIY
jgi:hypothetical protein